MPLLPLIFLILISLNMFPLANAEVTLDGSFGHLDHLSGTDIKIDANLGHAEGSNLFHSFGQFNIDPGQTITLLGDSQRFTNVISRVTGGEISSLQGTLKSEIPNVYLLNPAGIIFGPDAKLEIPGSFYVSTADYLRFDDGATMTATPMATERLTVASPVAFGFLDPSAIPSITVQQSTLEVPTKQSLWLAGGEITINKSYLKATQGQIHLASITQAGEIVITPTQESPSKLDWLFPAGKITIDNSKIGGDDKSTDAQVAQSIVIQGGQLFLTNNSLLNASKIRIASQDSINLETNTKIWADQQIDLQTQHLTMSHKSNITNRAGGTIALQANQLTMTDASVRNEGPLGNIIISPPTNQSTLLLEMKGTSQLQATSGTEQPAGKISITATAIKLFDDATLNVDALGTGNGGELKILTNSLWMQDRAWILGNTFQQGRGGILSIEADTIELSGDSVISTTTFSVGKAGAVNILARQRFSLQDHATIISGTEGPGAGGEIVLLSQGDQFFLGDATMISSASKMERSQFIQEIANAIGIAKQRGAVISEELFAGGGEPGKEYILQTKNLSLGNQGTGKEEITLQSNCALLSKSNDSSFKLLPYPGLDKALGTTNK